MLAGPIIDSAPAEVEQVDQYDVGYLDGHRDAILTVLELAVREPYITVEDVLAALEEEHPTLLTKDIIAGMNGRDVRSDISEAIRRTRLILVEDMAGPSSAVDDEPSHPGSEQRHEGRPPEWAAVTLETMGW